MAASSEKERNSTAHMHADKQAQKSSLELWIVRQGRFKREKSRLKNEGAGSNDST